jgi:hypothetical protein
MHEPMTIKVTAVPCEGQPDQPGQVLGREGEVVTVLMPDGSVVLARILDERELAITQLLHKLSALRSEESALENRWKAGLVNDVDFNNASEVLWNQMRETRIALFHIPGCGPCRHHGGRR